MSETLYVCPRCAKQKWLTDFYVDNHSGTTICHCQSRYDFNATPMIAVSRRTWYGNGYAYDVICEQPDEPQP